MKSHGSVEYLKLILGKHFKAAFGLNEAKMRHLSSSESPCEAQAVPAGFVGLGGTL